MNTARVDRTLEIYRGDVNRFSELSGKTNGKLAGTTPSLRDLGVTHPCGHHEQGSKPRKSLIRHNWWYSTVLNATPEIGLRPYWVRGVPCTSLAHSNCVRCKQILINQLRQPLVQIRLGSLQRSGQRQSTIPALYTEANGTTPHPAEQVNPICAERFDWH